MTGAATTGLPQRRTWPVVAAACGAALVTAAWRFLAFPGFNNDHYVHLARAYQILLGEWPVRDFADPGLPLMYLVHAASTALFGTALGVEWAVVTAGFVIGAACMAIVAARLSGSAALAFVLAAYLAALHPRSFGYPKIALYAVAALLIARVAARPALARIGALAFATAVAFLFRHDHGLFIGFGSLVAVVLASRSDGWRTAAARTAALGACTAVFLAPWALFVQYHAGLVEYLAAGVDFSRGEAVGNALRELPRFRWPGSPAGAFGSGQAWLFYTFHALPLACLAALVRRSPVEAWRGETTTVAALVAIAIPVNVTFLRGWLEGRIPDAAVPAALLGSWLVGLAFARGGRFRPARQALAVIGLATTGWAVYWAGGVRDQMDKAEVLHGPKAVQARIVDLWRRLQLTVPEGDHVPSRYSQALLPFIAFVDRCTSANDRLLVTHLFPEVYVMARRGFAGGHQSFQPGLYLSEADQALTIARLERQSVPFVVIVRQGFETLRSQMTRVFDYVDERWTHLVDIPVPETEGIEILVDRNWRDRAGMDGATGWPCAGALSS